MNQSSDKKYMRQKEILEIQNKKLCELMAYLGSNSPYYQKIFKTHQIDWNEIRNEVDRTERIRRDAQRQHAHRKRRARIARRFHEAKCQSSELRSTVATRRVLGQWRVGEVQDVDVELRAGGLSTIEFDVFGYDHRASGYKLEVVDSPAVIETLMDLVYPKYMVDEATSSHLPAENQPYLPSGTFIPVGTQVTLKFKTNKPLKKVEIVPSDGSDPMTIDIPADAKDPQSFGYRIDALKGSVSLEISLLDADNVAAERPFRVFLTAIEDQPPQVEVTLKGIGSSVTPDVIVPLRGKIGDDYGIQKTWAGVQVNDSGDERDRPFGLGKGGAVEHQIDFRYERAEKTGLDIKAGDKLLLAIKAADKYDLAGEPHVATGDRYSLDVVTPEVLLAQLEVREIGLRRRTVRRSRRQVELPVQRRAVVEREDAVGVLAGLAFGLFFHK
jgi:hypothetical protein